MSKLSLEVAARQSGDLSLTNRVSAEESNRTSGDLSLTNALSTETSLRVDGDASLTTRLSTEESLRGSADTSLHNAVSVETSFRVSGDMSLTNRLSAEESTRNSADASLTTRLSAEESVRASADLSIRKSFKDKVFMARVGAGFAAATSADGIALDTVAGSLFKSSDFKFVDDVIDMNIGAGPYTGKATFPENFQVFINGVMLRPVLDAGKVKTFIGASTVSFSGLDGDFVFYKNEVPLTGKIHFAFALKAGDEVQVRYKNS